MPKEAGFDVTKQFTDVNLASTTQIKWFIDMDGWYFTIFLRI